MGRFADAYIARPDRQRARRVRAADRGARPGPPVAGSPAPRTVPAELRHAAVPPAARFPPPDATGEGGGAISRRSAVARPAADARQRRRRRRRPGRRRSGARGRGAAERAGDQRAGDLPRRPAHGGAGARARVLRARHRGAAVPGLGLPALRPRLAARRHRGAAHDHAVAARAHQGPRQAVGAAHHRQRRAAARAGEGPDRQAGAVGRARQRARHGRA